MSAALDGPRIAASNNHPDALVVFLHGYGADGNDLIEVGRQWRQILPGAAFVSPNAPERCTGAPMGRQWFALANRPPDNPAAGDDRWNGAVKAREPLDAFLDAELQASRAGRLATGAGRFQPGNDDGAARRVAAAPGAGRDSRLFWPTHRRDAAGGGDSARFARIAPADPAGPRRSGSHDPARRDVSRGGRALAGGHACPMAYFFRHRPRDRWRRPETGWGISGPEPSPQSR